MLGGILDLARSTRDLDKVEALAHQCYKVTEDTINHPQHAWSWSWPLTGLPSPVKRQEASWTSTEKAALAAFHRERYVLASAQKKFHQEGGQDGGGGGGGQPKGEGKGKGGKGKRRGEERPEEGRE